MSAPLFVVRVDYPNIRESRYLGHHGQLVKESRLALRFKKKAEAQREADSMRAAVEQVQA